MSKSHMNAGEDIAFEISFFEDILRDKPNHPDVLAALGDAYTKIGRFEDGLKIDVQLVLLKPDDPIVHYNLACSYSLLRKADLCLDTLQKAVHLGYRDFSFMSRDPDLDFIRSDPRYKELLMKFSQKT